MKIRIVWWVSVMAALLFAATASSQPIVDCTCLSTQAQSLLITNGCQGIVPDLCQFTNCFRSTVVPPPPLFCSQSPVSGTVLGPGNHPITVTVMDASGQSAQCVLNFKVIPPPNPFTFDLLCASNKVVYCDIPWNFDPPTPTNYCCPQPGVPNGGVTISVIGLTTNGTCPAEITQTWLARDACGKVAMCSQTLTQVDVVAPIILCGSNQTVQCGVNWSFTPPSATDNCTASNLLWFQLVSTTTNFGCGQTYTAQQIWNVHDLCGNLSWCTQTVAVVDTTAPTIICGTNKTVQCGTQWSFDVPSVFDNCNNAAMPPTNITLTIVSTVTNGFCPRVITRTWRATDGCGNFSQCSQTVTVVDTIAPVLNCNCLRNNPNVPLNVVGCSNAIPNLCALTAQCASDNCGPVSCFQSPAAGTIVGPGTYPITVTVYDCASNSASCTLLFTVTAPATGCGTNTTNCSISIVCPTNVTAFTCSNSAVVAYPAPTVNNPCNSNITISCNPPSGSVFPIGTNSVSCFVLNSAGVVYDQCLFNVIVQTATNCPTNCAVRIICPTNVTAFTCSNSVVVNYPAPTVINPCASNIFVNCNPPSGSTFPVGTNTVTCVAGVPGTVPDQCSFQVIVTTPPGGCPTNCTVRIICPTNVFASTCSNSAVVTYPSPTVLNPCGSNVTIVCNPPSGSVFPLGTTSVGCVLINSTGVVYDQCSFSVTVQAATSGCPTNCTVRIVCPTNITAFTCSNSVVVNYPAPTVINPCSSNVFVVCNPPSGSTFPSGTNIVTCSVGVAGAISDQCSFLVTVTAPATGCPTNCTVRIVCPTNLTVTTCTNSAVVNYSPPTVINPCASNVFVVCNPPSGSTFPLGTSGVTCTVGNAAGPIDQCTFTVTVVQTAGGCCSNITQVFNTGMGGASGNVLLAAGTPDPNYFLVTAPGACNVAQVINTNTLPGVWVGTGPNSQWIGGGPNATCNQGFYHYRLAVNVTCPTGTTISGQWTADDYAEVFLNGVPTGFTAPSLAFPYSFTGWQPLILTNGFICGTNFIDFYVTNAHATANPTGFRAQLTNTYSSCCNPCAPINCAITVRCPTNLVVSTCGSNAVVNYVGPTVFNPCGSNISVICNPPSGSTFPIGTNGVACSVLDASGVVISQCGFSVAVVSSFCDFVNGDFAAQVPANGTGGGWTSSGLFGGAGWDTSVGNGPPSFLLNNVGAPNTDPMISQRLCCFRPGQCYTIRGQRRVQAWFGDTNLSFGVLLDGGYLMQLPVPSIPADTNWYNFSVSFTATSTCHTIGFAAEINGTDVSYWIDNLRIECCVTNNCISIVCPTNRMVQTCTNGRPVNYPAPIATSSCGTPIASVVCIPPSGSFFPLGTNTVTCTATDAQGNMASCGFLVIVTGGDTTPPNCPPFSMSVTGCPPVMPNFQTSGLITDNCTPSNLITVTQSIAPGTVLPPGSVTVVILTICDASGNCRVCDVVITAVGTGKPPVINCPKDITVLTCSNSAEVIYKVKATGGTFPIMNCTPPSGTLFPLGTNIVKCCVWDACGYTNCCSFKVIVKSAITVSPNWTATAGVPDNFALPVDAAFRTACLTNAFGGYPAWKGFDSYGIDTIFGHRFTGLPGNIVQAQLEIKMRPLNTYGADNDGLFIGLGSSCTLTSFVYAQSIKAIPGAVPPTGGTWSAPSNPPTVFTINLSSPAMLAKLNADQFMDVAVHDDTAVDYMRLRLWLCPPKHPGIGIPFSTLNSAKFAVRPATEDDDQAGPAVTVYPDPDPTSPPSGIVLTPGTPKKLTFTTVLDFGAPEGAAFDIGLPPSPENPNGASLLSFRSKGKKGYCVKSSTKLWDDKEATFRTIAIGTNGHLFSSYPWSPADLDTNVLLNLVHLPDVTQAVMTVSIDLEARAVSLSFPHCIWTPDNARKGWDGCIYGNGTPSKGTKTNHHARLILEPVSPAPHPRITELALTAAGLHEFVVEDPDVELSGRKWGDGHVTLMKAYDDGEEANRMMEWTSFGEGGGVNVDLGRTTSLDLGIHHFETGDIPTEEQVFRIMLPPRGLTNRPAPPSIPLRMINGPNGLECSVDFTDVGATGVTVQLWNNGQLVGEGHGEGPTIPPEGPLTISNWPERWGYIVFNQSIHLYRSEGLMVSGLTGDEIRIYPDLSEGGSPFDYASGLELRTSEGMESVAYGLVRTLACEPGPLHVERSSTGTTLSWSEEGFRLQGAETVEGPWYDLGVESPVTVEASALMHYFRLTCD